MRYPYFDNAKAVLIFLVVFGHFIVQRGIVGEDVYWLIYTFHMPAFVFVAGYFTKKESWSKTMTSVIGQFILPYIIFQSLYNLYNYYVFNRPMNLEFEYANFALWFLLAMSYWKITLQIILRWKWTLLLFLLLYATHRFFLTDLNYFDIGRLITFSVFFYLGHFAKVWTPKVLTFIQKVPYRAFLFPFVSILGMVTVSELYQHEQIPLERQWFYGTFNSFDAMLKHTSASELLMNQVEATLLSLLMVLFFLLIVPTKQYVWTSIGGATLSVYLLHGFIRNIFVYEEYLFKADTWGELGALAVLALLIVYILSRKPFHLFVTFISTLLKKKQE